MHPRDVLPPAPAITMIVLALLELHLEIVAGAAAWLAAWWMLRDVAAH